MPSLDIAILPQVASGMSTVHGAENKLGMFWAAVSMTHWKSRVGHNCPTCRANYEKLGWEDKILTPDPFIDEDCGSVHDGEGDDDD